MGFPSSSYLWTRAGRSCAVVASIPLCQACVLSGSGLSIKFIVPKLCLAFPYLLPGAHSFLIKPVNVTPVLPPET